MKKSRVRRFAWMIVVVVLVPVVLLLMGKVVNNSKKAVVQKGAPQANMFYVGSYLGARVLFFRSSDAAMANMMGGNDQYKGSYISLEQIDTGHLVEHTLLVDFRKLQNPRELFSFERYAKVENVLLSADKRYLMLSFVGGRRDSTNYIYQVDLERLVSKQFWEHEVASGYPPYNGGVAFVTQFIPDRFVVFAIVKGDPPPRELPSGVVVMDLVTARESVLGVAGDVKVDLTSKRVSYRLLGVALVPCEGDKDQDCFAGDVHKRAYEPVGEIHIQPLL